MTKNAYIHIPFCKSKCKYCSFISFDKLELKGPYLNALEKQIKAEYQGEKLNTLYIGGGTPSLLTIKELKNLIDLFTFEDDAEITVEVNPDSINLEFLDELHKLGVNRLSIGAQTFNDEILKLIGRRHNSEQIIFALNCAREAGFKNISLDFIYGLPNQNMNDFVQDLKTAIDLNVEHISLYGLKLDKGCDFYEKPPENIPNQDTQADMYLKAVEILKNRGFEHYEISNFGIKSFESKHNLNYWNNNTYYGFGCSASGYIDKIRYQMTPDLEKYIHNPFNRDFEQELSEQEILEEAIFLGLRKTAGINIEEINNRFEINFEKEYAKVLDKYSDYLIKTQKNIALTLKGAMISNEILVEFIRI